MRLPSRRSRRRSRYSEALSRREPGEPEGGGDPEIAIQGITDSLSDQSAGVQGEATGGTGIVDGVRGVSASVNGVGIRGTSSALTGVTAGVWGAAASPAGFGGFVFNLGLGDPGGTGNQWDTNDQFESGGYGTVGATGSTWSWVNNNACDVERRLYCVQQ